MYRAELAEVYDTVYLARKDYPAEAALVTRLVRERHPAARSLLDVACGTGEHLRSLRSEFAVAGVDASADMIAIARAKLPGVPVSVGDMRELALGATYDAVCCLFSAVAYLPGTADLDTAVARMAAHLNPGGVLLVEPFLFPEEWRPGYTGYDSVETDQRHVVRVSRSGVRDRSALLDMHYLIADAAGIRHFREVEELSLFTRAEFETAFARAGCSVEYLPGPPDDRGLFVGVAGS